MLIYKKNTDKHSFVDNGEKEVYLSTWKILKTLVFHKVVHIIHSCTQGKMSYRREQMCFLWKSEKPEKPPFFILRKNVENE